MNRQKAGHSIQILKNRAFSVSCDQEDKCAFQPDKLKKEQIAYLSIFLPSHDGIYVDMMKTAGQEKCQFRIYRHEKAGKGRHDDGIKQRRRYGAAINAHQIK